MGRPLLFIPTWQCADALHRALLRIGPDAQRRFDEVFVLDNGSWDGTPQVARDLRARFTDCPLIVGRNDANYDLGGSHKVAFERALALGSHGVVVLHGDDQGRLDDLLPHLPAGPADACVLGARFRPPLRLHGYPRRRIVGNALIHVLFTLATRRVVWDFGAGLAFYRREFVARGLWRVCRDDHAFPYDLLLRAAAIGEPVRYVPIAWHGEDHPSTTAFLHHGQATLRLLARYLRDPEAFAIANHSGFVGERTYTQIV